jgi:exopolyphosphatase / guanosine-5'-triphosphate,3'-diphosphate pyrophosphatase
MPIFAAVDVGSNSVRLKIASLRHGQLKTIAEDREVTRLGESVFRNGMLDPKAIDQTVKVLRRFHRTVTKLGVDTVRVVATSALRDAGNSSSFAEWVQSATGWHPEIISGIEEGRLIHLGVVSNTRITTWPLLLMDLGGGSCEVTTSIEGRISSMVSLPLGAVRLTEDFIQSDPPKTKELERLRQFIAEEVGRLEQRMRRRAPQKVIATSGTAETLSALAAKFDSASRKNFVSCKALAKVNRELVKRNLTQRRTMQGLGPRRAEIIVAGATVFQELVERFDLSGFTYSPLGLRDGLLAQMSAEHDRSTALGRKLQTERESGLAEAAAHYGADQRFSEHVRDLALLLFRQLKAVHRLPEIYEDWISAGATLHEVGSFISRAGRHRHAYYIIANSEIYGLTAEQRRIVAAIARYMGKSTPGLQDRALRAVPSADRQLIPRAVALLRLARAMNIGRRSAVSGVTARSKGAQVALKLQTRRGGAELEIWSLMRERSYFREVFGRELVVADD